MARLKHEKVAEAFEAKGQFKKAADYYAQAARYFNDSEYLKKAFDLYEKALSKTTDPFVIRNIENRLKKLGSPSNLIRTTHKAHRRSLDRMIYGIVSIAALSCALFLVSFNLTGNSIGNLSGSDLPLFGVALFFFGLIFFVFFKARKK
jgi:tetratricopeptide (TPR) repeat protein